jgi:hypothetical protein
MKEQDMSVDCAICFNDPERTVTRMTVWSYDNSQADLDVGRALMLAYYAYESRKRRPPPMLDGKLDGVMDILAIHYRARKPDAKTFMINNLEYRQMMLFAQIFGCLGEKVQP